MKNKKRNTIITSIIIGFILLCGAVFFFLNNSVVDTGLSVLEKKWINDYKDKIVDVYVYNDVPVYGYNGSGVNFDFLDFFTEKYGVSFNKISYYTSTPVDKIDFGFKVLKSNEKISDNDILLNTDYYAIMSLKEKSHVVLQDVHKLGILNTDYEVLKNYFPGDMEFVQYKNYSSLVNGIKNEEVSYICSPVLQYMDQELEYQLSIVYRLTDLQNKLVLRVNDATIYEVMRKSYSEYLEKSFDEDYGKNYLNVYFNATNTEDIKRKNYNSKVYHYGYVVNMPFENQIKDEFVGTLSNYINEFEKISSSEIEVIAYSTIDDLKSALVSGEIDFALANFDYKNINLKYVTTHSIRDLDYVVLSKKKISMNSVKGLGTYKISVVSGSLLYQLCKDNHLTIQAYADTNELLRSMDDESIVLIDKETYRYYQEDKLASYYVLLEDTISNGYQFILNQSNDTFNGLFQYYVQSIDYSKFMYQYHTNIRIEKDYTSFKIGLFIIALILFLVATVVFMNRKNVTNVVPKKDERLKYIDPLTSLKNRSYLNKNIYSWDDNVIFPQSVIVFDLDHIKRVNDKFGRETGDEIIKQVAGILINQQLENTDIIRSDGDEFIVYMVGYEEAKVKEYMKKLLRLMKDIPKSLGVEAGYSMIFDEVKTVDDAINEAISMMMKSKEDE